MPTAENIPLRELEAQLRRRGDTDALREELFAEFLRYADYTCISEWNHAVLLCESLAIIGWGAHEPVEALRDVYVNGAPNTFFANAMGCPRFTDAIWKQSGKGLMIDAARTRRHASPDDPHRHPDTDNGHGHYSVSKDSTLQSQRNWIAKNPIWIKRTLDNCYPGSRAVIDSIDRDLQPALDAGMRPQLYGQGLNRIIINCAFSFDDGPHCKTNYIIADEGRRLRQSEYYPTLLGMYTEDEIEANGYYLRPRYSHGPFRTDTGRVNVSIMFEREFSGLSHREQKAVMSEYFLTAATTIATRVKKRLPAYDSTLMLSDFRTILNTWQTT